MKLWDINKKTAVYKYLPRNIILDSNAVNVLMPSALKVQRGNNNRDRKEPQVAGT
jgi:hypothetical protein